MKVVDCIKAAGGNAISVEIEPPRIGHTRQDVFDMLDPLVELGISYVNITYHGARIVDHSWVNGKKFPLYQRLHPGTSGIAGAIAERYQHRGIFPVPHVICTGFTRYDTEDFLHELACLGVTEVLALRGDSPRGEDGQVLPFSQLPGGHAHATQLIEQIQALTRGQYSGAKSGHPIQFGIGAACYPEGHPESRSLDEDMYYTKAKVDMGAEYLVSQMSFDTDAYARFQDNAQRIGINVPIIPGIKPLTSYRHLSILPDWFHCHIPDKLREAVENAKDHPEDIRKIGIEFCLRQCERLKELGAPSLHFYAARKAPIRQIIRQLKEISYAS